MDELENIKRRKLEEMQRQYQDQASQQMAEEEQAQQQISALESMVRQKLSKEALQRYGNLKAAHPEKAVQLLVVLAKLMQMGRIDIVTDEQLKSLLLKMASGDERKTTITRK